MEWILPAIPFLVHAGVFSWFGVRVMTSDRPVNVTLAWLAVLLFAPYVGAVFYWLIGENQLGMRRGDRASALVKPIQMALERIASRNPVDWSLAHPMAEPIHMVAESIKGAPAIPDNHLEIYSNTEATLRAIRDDIDRSRTTCHLLFYIWQDGGIADEVSEALIRASRRGVVCRVLVDYVGSGDFLDGEMARRMRSEGVQIEDAFEVGPLRIMFQRIDLRNHRKVVVIDGEIAYTGSMNLVDPAFFKVEAQVGEWVDAMVRLRGPAVEVLNLVFLRDWDLETEVGTEELVESGDMKPSGPAGDDIVQVVPSTPGLLGSQAIHELLLKTIYSARRELIITTPYFVPTDAVMYALTTSARSGVDVTLVVPERVDSFLVRYASEATYQKLMEAGVTIARFQKGLLHSKTITVDSQIAMIGSTNMDMRSFYINLEVTLFSYTPNFAHQLRQLQRSYVAQSSVLDTEEWSRRPRMRRLLQSAVRLASPLL